MSNSIKDGIKVMHVIETLDVGGAETVVANIVNNMSSGFRPSICCLIKSGPIAERIQPGIDILELGKAAEGNDYLIPVRLSNILRKKDINIVQSHDWGTLLETVAAATLSGTTAVHMAHGPTSHYPSSDRWGAIKKNLRRKAERIAAAKLSCAIAVSEIVRKELVEEVGIPGRKVILVRNGIDLAADSCIGDLDSKRRYLNLEPDDVLFITVGRLAKIKNYALLLKALALAAGQVPNVKLALIGDGPERTKLEQDAQGLGLADRVYFLGERSDVREWLDVAHGFVLPSLYEGISIALLEAMAAGLPAIATNVGGNPEVIIEGENGLLVESGDYESLSRALIKIASDMILRKRMGRAARERAESEFELKQVVRRYEKIYTDILGKVRI